MKKVSVIVPVYNAERFIEVGINSVLNQTYKNIELLLIDDGSKDSSLSILKKYEKKHKDIIKVFHKKNSGVGDTRNYGIEKSSGDYITFMDADDYLDENYIETMIESIGDNDILVSGYKQVDENHNLIFNRIINNRKSAKFRQMVVWAKLYKRLFLVENKIIFNKLKIGEDITFSLDTYMNTNKIKCILYTGYNNVSNDFSVTKDVKLKKQMDINSLINNLCIRTECNNYVCDNKKELRYFFMKIFCNFLYDKSRVLNYNELKEYYSNGITILKSYFKKNKIRFKLVYSRDEPLKVNVAINIVVIFDKLKLTSFFLKLLIKTYGE